MATDAEALAAGFTLPVGGDLISLGDNAISQNARAATDILLSQLSTLPWKGALSGSANVDTLPNGIWEVNGSNAALQAKGLPARLGNLMNLNHGRGGFTQMMLTAATPSYSMEIYARASNGDGTTPRPNFERVYPPVIETRRAPVALNHPRGTDTDSRPLVQVRIPVKFAADVHRIRAIFRNYDYNSNTPYMGALNFAGIAIGKHQIKPDGSMTGLFPEGETPQVLRNAFTSPDDASTFGSSWTTVDLKAGEEYLLSYAYEAANTGQVNAYQLGACFTNLILSSWVRPGSVTSIYQAFSPLSVMLEVEVDADTDVFMYIGDSHLASLNGKYPCRDSWAQKHAQARGAIASVLAQPGGSMADYADVMTPKLRMWSHLDKPDRVYLANGYNDIGNGANLATLKTRFETMAQNVMNYYGNDLYLCTILPKATDPTLNEVRWPFNDYLQSLPMDAEICADHYAAIVDPATGKTDTRWSASPGNAHLNSGGSARMAVVTP